MLVLYCCISDCYIKKMAAALLILIYLFILSCFSFTELKCLEVFIIFDSSLAISGVGSLPVQIFPRVQASETARVIIVIAGSIIGPDLLPSRNWPGQSKRYGAHISKHDLIFIQ